MRNTRNSVETARGTIADILRSAADQIQTVEEAASRTVEHVDDKANTLVDTLYDREKRRELRHQAGEQISHVRDRASEMARSKPVMTAVGAVAAGVALSVALFKCNDRDPR